MGELNDRRTQTAGRLAALRQELQPSALRAKDRACVYATGSFGRCEASSHSDLDVFIVGLNLKKSDGKVVSKLPHLDDICVMADLVQTTKSFRIPDFSGDGEYLKHYSLYELTNTLGTREDDVANTFTARLLLLLESTWLVEEAVYGQVIKEVIKAYWRDYENHKNEFVPAFLTNDILRLWRTFCVNYEAGTERVPAEKRAKGRLKNYKLKHSRLLTCYSAILYLLAVFKRAKTVTPEDAAHMSSLTPTERVEWLNSQTEFAEASPALNNILGQYEEFLRTTDAPESDLIERFKTKEMIEQCAQSGFKLGDYAFEALRIVGQDNHLYRLLVV